ncbi:MAG: substrate-binding domain-containing protein [Lewinellaceae bacterium]|nr:substrate-binding domain-containing protein [Lewinellaceae bacterium]
MLFVLVFAIVACQQTTKDGKVLDTPTTGHLKMMVDEGYKPIVASSIDVFDSIYRSATIDAIYCSEGEAINALLKDSIQVIVITRELSQEEIDKYFKPRGFTPKQTSIAYDAVGFIQNPLNTDTTFTVEQIRDILSGKITKWNQINPQSKLGDIRLVFDNPLSGTVRYARDSIAGGAPLSPNASALNTNEEVIKYVSENKNAIGVISANVISDTDDKGVQKFLAEIRLCRIATEAGKRGYGPYQAYLATGQYPFKRTVYIINAQARSGLGLGIASFLAGPTGQTIVLKDGLLPARAVTRLIEVQR